MTSTRAIAGTAIAARAGHAQVATLGPAAGPLSRAWRAISPSSRHMISAELFRLSSAASAGIRTKDCDADDMYRRGPQPGLRLRSSARYRARRGEYRAHE